jgi:hypothetical protein
VIEIIEAISAKYDATPTMSAGLTGGFHLNHPGPGHPRPFAVLVPIAAPVENNTSTTYLQDAQFQISIFANTMAEVASIKKAWIASLKNKRLPLSAGNCLNAELTNELPTYDPQEDDELSAWHYVLEFTFTQNQTPL